MAAVKIPALGRRFSALDRETRFVLLARLLQSANGFLLSRGSIVRRGEPKSDLSDATWRVNTQWLFTPACAAMRRDPRFLPLCDAMGLGDYWHRRRVEPDYLQR